MANIALWHSPGLVAVLLLLMGTFLGLVIPANNATVLAAVPANASAVTGGMVNAARALGTALGVAPGHDRIYPNSQGPAAMKSLALMRCPRTTQRTRPKSSRAV